MNGNGDYLPWPMGAYESHKADTTGPRHGAEEDIDGDGSTMTGNGS